MTTAQHAASAPDTALAPYASPAAPATPELAFNERQVELIKRLIAPGLTDDEFALFLEVCRTTGLNPLMRQIYAIKRRSGDENRMTIQTGIDGYRLLSARRGDLAGIDAPVFDTEEGAHPNWARVTVWKFVNGQRVPFTATARWREYAALGRDGKPVAMWAKMGWHMLGKCAEAQAHRMASPAELSGLYTAEEMAQADNPPLAYVESEPEPQQVAPARPQTQQTATPPAKRAAAPAPKSPWKALTDADVLASLDRMGINGKEATTEFLGTIKASMESQGLAWTRDQVLAQLREYEEEEAASGESTFVDAEDLAALEMGAPGN